MAVLMRVSELVMNGRMLVTQLMVQRLVLVTQSVMRGLMLSQPIRAVWAVTSAVSIVIPVNVVRLHIRWTRLVPRSGVSRAGIAMSIVDRDAE